MSEAYNPHLKALILQVVDNQLNENDPPITRVTLDRLIAAGYSKKRAKEMIGSVVAEFIFYAMHDNIPYDEKKYVQALEQLR